MSGLFYCCSRQVRTHSSPRQASSAKAFTGMVRFPQIPSGYSLGTPSYLPAYVRNHLSTTKPPLTCSADSNSVLLNPQNRNEALAMSTVVATHDFSKEQSVAGLRAAL